MKEDNQELKPKHFAFVKRGVEFIQQEEPSLVEVAQSSDLIKLIKILNDDFGWAHLYECPAVVTGISLTAACGLLPILKEKRDSGVEINQAMMDVSESSGNHCDSYIENAFKHLGDNPSPEQVKSVRFGFNNLFCLSDLFALTYANLGHFAALRKFGKDMYRLVQEVNQGEEESFFHAIQIDPTVLSCTPFIKRISIAHMQGDTKFIKAVSNALKTKWKKPKTDLESLRVSLSMFNELNQLNDLSQIEAAKLFIDELNMYSNEGDDPERGLFRFIQRYKASLRHQI